MARSPVTGLIEQYNALTDVEQKVFLDMVDPQVEQPKNGRKKKQRAEPLSEERIAALRRKGLPTDQRCIAIVPGLNVECRDPEDNKVHDKSAGYAGYHKFEHPKPVASVTRRSSRKGAGTNSIPSTAGETENALSASSGGD